MKILMMLAICVALAGACKKPKTIVPSCDIEQTRTANSAKVNINDGLWGTVSLMEGNCMPVVGPGSTCRHCPVKRTLKIYAYANYMQATPQNLGGMYTSIGTTLIQEIQSDNDGFYQVTLPAGKYTIVSVEEGKLYTFGFDNEGGLSPVTITGGKKKTDLILTYRATF